MAERKKKKKKQLTPLEVAVDDTRMEFQGEHVYNYFTLNNANVVQIGSDNSVAFKEAHQLLENPQGKSSHGLGKKEIFIGLINSVINPTCTLKAVEMPLKTLERQFVDHFKGRSLISSFKDAYGVPLRHFLEMSPELYTLYSKKGKETVRMKARTGKKEKTKAPEGFYSCVPHQTVPKQVDEQDLSTASLPDADQICVPVMEEQNEPSVETPTETVTEASQPGEWHMYTRKRKETKKSVTVSASTLQESPTDSVLLPEFDNDSQYVKDLLHKQESDVLIFYTDESVYSKNQVQFMIDVVSLWNTPSRHKASIVLGVRVNTSGTHHISGIQVRSGNDYYHCLFQADNFTMKPVFEYKEYVYEGKVVGIIEVASSYGGGAPSIVKNDINQNVKADQLWVRSGKENRICLQKDFLTVQIYQWFAGQTSPGHSSVKSGTPIKFERTEHVEATVKISTDERSKTEDFCSVVGNFDKGHFVLITGGIPENTKYVESLALVPWVAVYDFDETSRDIGLLSTVEDVIKDRRYLHVSTWRNNASGITESGTQWVFMRGLREIPDSRTDDNPKRWLQTVRGNLDSICLQLARFSEDYTVLRLLVLWPENEIITQCIYKFICRLNEHLQDQPRIILCYEKENMSQISKSAMDLLLSECSENTAKIKISFTHLCAHVEDITKKIDVKTRITYALPKEAGHVSPALSNKDAAWLKEDLEVLYLSNPYTKGASDLEELNKEVDNFFRGGTLHWFAWYELGTTHVDVEREITEKVVEHIDQKFIKEFKSGVVTLFHAPGAGGTTAAQQIIWELRKKVACCQIKRRSGSSLDELEAKIRFLYDNTHLPVVLLIDGEDEPRVKQLHRGLKSACVILLYVKRFPYRFPDQVYRPRESKFWLKGEVSGEEAKILALKFSERCEKDSKRKKLHQLCKEVQCKRNIHFMYEFGMTVYHNEFKGIEAFVKGFLRLDTNPTRELQPWQKILGYLSLVYYYGQASMPCKVFATLLCKPPNYDVTIEDFNHPISHFIVEESIDGTRKNIRICHYFLAKEILEQLLNRSGKRSQGESLSKEAKRNLQSFCTEFISMFRSKKEKFSRISSNLVTILARTFIFRDNRDVGENEPQNKKRPLFSQVILDVDSKPPYSGRLEVLKKLTSTFPDDPNFLAHLGRFYAYCRPEEEHMAEKCFKDALELCKRWTSSRVSHGTDEGVKLTLMHIYHMYGMIYQRRIAKFTGKGPDESPDIKTSPEEFPVRAQEILNDAETACTYFTQCRESTPSGHEECYGFSNEILVRLQVCDFVSRNYRDGGMSKFLSTRRNSLEYPVAQFIKESITDIEDLILECYSLIDPDNIDHTFEKAVVWYNILFGKNPVDLRPLLHGEDPPSRRLLITVKKLEYSREGNLSIFDGYMANEHVAELVHLYEENFEDAKVMGDCNKRHLEMDHKEWLSAIRHSNLQKNYNLHDVLCEVKFWHESVQSPTSKFYHFVLLSLIGFGTVEKRGNSESLVEAQMLKEEMMKLTKTVIRPRFPREWMGKNNCDIRRLVPNTKISGHIDARRIKGNLQRILAVCKGTIAHPNNKKLGGTIDLDLGNNSIPIKVFFIPLLADFCGTRFAGQRVQFYLAFTLDHGYEAYNVQELCKYSCLTCGQKLEIKLDEDYVTCKCGATVEKTEPSQVVSESSHSSEDD